MELVEVGGVDEALVHRARSGYPVLGRVDIYRGRAIQPEAKERDTS
jgi:hypothetical protein